MATYFINADTGNDSTGTGASATPWKTITKANTSATTGDTIIVMSATSNYTAFDLSAVGDAGKSLTISGQNVSTCVFLGTVYINFLANTTNNISNITLDGNGTHTGSNNMIFGNGSTVNFTNMLFKRFYGYSNYYQSIKTTATNSTLTFTNCIFRDFDNSTNIVYANADATNVLNIYNCLFYWGAGTTPSAPIGLGTCTYTIKNNIFKNDTGYALSMTNTNTYSCFRGVASTLGTGSISGDPLFVDVANGNYNLRPTSPCINTGTLI